MKRRRPQTRMSQNAIISVTILSKVCGFATLSSQLHGPYVEHLTTWRPKNSPLDTCSLQITISRQEMESIDDNKENELQQVLTMVRDHGTIIQKSRRRKVRQERIEPVHSFVKYLAKECTLGMNPPEHFSEELSATTVSAIRAAGSAGDFRLIRRIVETMIQFASCHGPLLTPRIFGEAIDNLSTRTRANSSKIRLMWQLAVTHGHLLKKPLGAFELNVYIKALASRGKIRASLDAIHYTEVVPDSYTASTLFGVLTDSIQNGQDIVDGSSPDSPCWQWNEALSILHVFSESGYLNNHAYAAVLKLNSKVAEVYDSPGRRHHGAKSALSILERMKQSGISPDVVTCTMVLSALDKGCQWSAAVALLNHMARSNDRKSGDWALPKPNVYSYAAAVSACASCGQYEKAVEIVDLMRQPESDVAPNTCVYNAALRSFVDEPRAGRENPKPLSNLLSLFDQMENDRHARPDIISYNTVLAALNCRDRIVGDQDKSLRKSSRLTDHLEAEVKFAKHLIVRMKQRGVQPNAITYRNAMKAVASDPNAVLDLFEMSLADSLAEHADSQNVSVAGEGIFIANSALSVLGRRGDVDSIRRALRKMEHAQIKADSESLNHVLAGVGNKFEPEIVLRFIRDVQAEKDMRINLTDGRGVEVLSCAALRQLPSIGLEHYSTAISACLSKNDLKSAFSVLEVMKEKELVPDDDLLEKVVLAYCRMAMDASYEETRKKVSRKRKKQAPSLQSVKSDSEKRARNAHELSMTLKSPPLKILAAVARALGAAGLWQDGQGVLRSIHVRAIDAYRSDTISQKVDYRGEHSALKVLPGLHRSLLKLCARDGNVTAAFSIVDEIQCVSKWLSRWPPQGLTDNYYDISWLESREGSFWTDVDSLTSGPMNTTAFHNPAGSDVGMKGEDWKLLMIAASKSGHSKACMGTLQFLRPFLEETNPNLHPKGELKTMNRSYGKLSRALTAAVLCFEMRSQYAWAVRAIDDWMRWSGRCPPQGAALAVFRVLAARGSGEEVASLLSKVFRAFEPATEIASPNYLKALVKGAVTALNRNGLYECADDVFTCGVHVGLLPFVIKRSHIENATQLTLDLHDMNTALAHSAVRVALQRDVQTASWNQKDDLGDERVGDIIVVTGKGTKSRFRPVLRPEVQRMLTEEFYPPLSTSSNPRNLGALRILSCDVNAWLDHQRKHKSARMLELADVIKNISSGDRIRKLISLSHRFNCSEDGKDAGVR